MYHAGKLPIFSFNGLAWISWNSSLAQYAATVRRCKVRLRLQWRYAGRIDRRMRQLDGLLKCKRGAAISGALRATSSTRPIVNGKMMKPGPVRSTGQPGQTDKPEQNDSVYPTFSLPAAASRASSETSRAGSSSIWSSPIVASFMIVILLFAQWRRQLGGEIAVTLPTQFIKSSTAVGVNHTAIDCALPINAGLVSQLASI
jgi:hypothetical protein